MWISDGKTGFTIEPSEREARGTNIILHLKDDQKGFLEEYELRTLVRKYSDYVRHPIRLQVERNTHANVFLFPLILPIVLMIKLLELVVTPKDSEHTNLSWPIPGFVHGILHGIFAAELPVTRRFDWPVGHSIAAIARRPAA